MALKTCNSRECRNPIRSTETYCYLHGGRSKAELDAGGGGVYTVADWRRDVALRESAKSHPQRYLAVNPPRPSLPVSRMDDMAQSYARHLPVSPETARTVLQVTQDVLGEVDIEVPAHAAAHREKIRQIARRLKAELGEERVSVVRMEGMTRKTATRSRVPSPHATHEVLLLDEGTEEETVIDPFIAALAPVSKKAASVRVVDSGMRGAMRSPYVDAPWMGDLDEYRANGHIEWARASRT